ncbi:MAG: YebC/PmpR family DNA-binding transcriptional regulator [Deltaproteobacteria bacterium]|nr:YebC/PmpR family DNA-binding transcriptional regulator [Deltaproteobacteria bacterium]
MSGHSKWATIKRKKGALDAARGRLFTKLIKEITVAARMGGGDPGGNPRLRKAVDDAKGGHLPGDTIARAIKRGTGELEGVSFEEVLYEGTGPAGTLFLVEGSTDNRNRSAAELRRVFEKHGGAMGGSGAAAWAFERRGLIVLSRAAATEDQLMEVAVGGGADDYADDGDSWTVLTPPSSLDAVVSALQAAGCKVDSGKLGYVPKARKEVRGREAEVCLNLAEALDEHDDVATVYVDFEVPADELERLEAAD